MQFIQSKHFFFNNQSSKSGLILADQEVQIYILQSRVLRLRTIGQTFCNCNNFVQFCNCNKMGKHCLKEQEFENEELNGVISLSETFIPNF